MTRSAKTLKVWLAACCLPLASHAQLPVAEQAACTLPQVLDCPAPGPIMLPALPAIALPPPAALPLPVIPPLPTVALPTPSLPSIPNLPVALPTLPVALPMLPNLPGNSPAEQVLRELLQGPVVGGPLSPILAANPCADPLACVDSLALEQALAPSCAFTRAPQLDLDFGSLPPTQGEQEGWRTHSGVEVRCGPGVRYRFRLIEGTQQAMDGTLKVRIGNREARVRIEADGRPVDSSIHVGDGQPQLHTIDAVLLAALDDRERVMPSGALSAAADVRLLLEW